MKKFFHIYGIDFFFMLITLPGHILICQCHYLKLWCPELNTTVSGMEW